MRARSPESTQPFEAVDSNRQSDSDPTRPGVSRPYDRPSGTVRTTRPGGSRADPIRPGDRRADPTLRCPGPARLASIARLTARDLSASEVDCN